MGGWGMGLAQTDEFCEVYDDFMERYDEGKEPAEISEEILAEQNKEFDDSDGVMHDVYFALAKAEWMCGALSEKIFARVKEIIESGANIAFYRELEATESDLKLRKKNLEKFLASIQIPREKPRARKKRRQPPPAKELPPVKAGECYRYKYGEGWRVVIILERFPKDKYAEAVFACVLRKTFSKDELKSIDFLNEKVGFAAYRVAEEFLSASSLKKIGEIPCDISIKRNGVIMEMNWLPKKGFKESFEAPKESFAAPLEITVKKLMELLNDYYNKSFDFGRYEVGDVYAYEFDGAYRAFAVLDIFQYPNKPELALCAIFKNKYTSFDCDFMKEDIYLRGTYTANELSLLRNAKKVAKLSLPKRLQEKIYGNGIIQIGSMYYFISDGFYVPHNLEKLIEEGDTRFKIGLTAGINYFD